MRTQRFVVVSGIALGAFLIAATAAAAGQEEESLVKIEKKTCAAPDGVKIVYSAAGKGEPALVFIHGGLANRGFYDGQLRAFSDRHRVIALDLPGHGESGLDRKKWGIPEFGADVAAVCDAEKLDKVILLGNSLGGPVAIEAALVLGDRAKGVIGIDTFQSLDYTTTEEQARQRAEAFRNNYKTALKEMVKSLFHKDADPELIADTEKRMSRTSPEAAYQMFLSMGGYNVADSARRLAVPLRAVNGDLYPTDLKAVRKVKRDFEAVIMLQTGHYPMLERPAEFNRNLMEFVLRLSN